MTKRDRLAQALKTRNKVCDLAQQAYLEDVERLNLPEFKIDWSENMRRESKRQDILIAPIREEYHAARKRAWKAYKATV